MSALGDDIAGWLRDAGFDADLRADVDAVRSADDPWADRDVPTAALTQEQLAVLQQAAEWLADLDDLEAGGAGSVAPPSFMEPGERLGD